MPPPTYTYKGHFNRHDPVKGEGNSFNFYITPPISTSFREIRFTTFKNEKVPAFRPNQKVAVTFKLTGMIIDGQCRNYLNSTKIEADEFNESYQNQPYKLSGIVQNIKSIKSDWKIVIQHGEDHFNHFRISSDYPFSLPKVGNSVTLEFELSSYLFDGRHQVVLKITDITVL